MAHYDYNQVLENQVFKDEANRFYSALESDLCYDISENDKKLLRNLPDFIARAHPFVFKSKNCEIPFFGLRKDMKTAYAAHPLNLVNILMEFGFHEVVTLFQAGFHDNPEEFQSLKKKATAKNLTDKYTSSQNDFLVLDTILIPQIQQFSKDKNIVLPDRFNYSVKKGVQALTPSKYGWRHDFTNLDENKDSYFVKCADTISVNRDPDGMLAKYKGNVPNMIGKLQERVDKIDILYDKGKKYLDKKSKERSLIMAIEDCREYLEDFTESIINFNGAIDEQDLLDIRRKTLVNHPLYRGIAYDHNKY